MLITTRNKYHWISVVNTKIHETNELFAREQEKHTIKQKKLREEEYNDFKELELWNIKSWFGKLFSVGPRNFTSDYYVASFSNDYVELYNKLKTLKSMHNALTDSNVGDIVLTKKEYELVIN